MQKNCQNNGLQSHWKAIREIEERLLAKNKIKKVLIGGSPYDETSKFNNFILRNKNNAILKIIDAQRTSAKKRMAGVLLILTNRCVR